MSINVITKTAVELATRGMPLEDRVNFSQHNGVTLGRLLREGLSAIELAELAEVTPQTIYSRIRACYTSSQYQELLAAAFTANRALHREAARKVFFDFRNFPELAKNSPALVKAFGSAEEVERQIRAAQRIGAVGPASLAAVRPLLAV